MRHLAVLAVFLAVATSGCAGPAANLRQDNARLQGDLGSARAELRRDRRRIHDLENENVVLRDRADTAAVAADRRGVPRLPVEVLAPDDGPGATPPAADLDPSLAGEYGDDARVVATTDDGTAIVYVGEAASGHAVEAPDDLDLAFADDLEYAPDDDDEVHAEPAPPPPRPKAHARPGRAKTRPRVAAAEPAPRPARADDATDAYQAAVALVQAKAHADAITALRAFLDAYPRHDLADNAQYWLGEVYYDQKDWARATVEFRAVIERYPKGNKVPDAMLKLGYCFAAVGQPTKARAALEQVISVYPRSQPAQLAARKLEELGR
ncbi:MAG: tol-pal system protein YbgF [Kofleriaceae bacterium]|nr:tol-pal system protein YbgF [Kofleriaceae bacterium]MCB9574743.1 tol-pal system protein YbgF [Kofleriaceae bacterium]